MVALQDERERKGERERGRKGEREREGDGRSMHIRQFRL